ncbi:hypothetical protein THRCLA_21056 [Thraustotheca clavata]|uniref:Tim44-like domain-containing protein n=1 Tax=Thraustotheca clavata TaxID=74557 RepID=A0A1W0A0N4_9STRA|nr:hypothetical protein THRCLA_21056 [Thraustotheca clavata]
MFLRHSVHRARDVVRKLASSQAKRAVPNAFSARFMQPHMRLLSTSAPKQSDDSEWKNPVVKAYSDKERFFDWDKVDLFATDASLLGKMVMFIQLHAAVPHSNVPFDIPDFLDGAKHAIDTVLRTVYTPAFFDGALNPAVENEEFALLRSVMGSKCVEVLLRGFSDLAKAGCTKFDLTQLEIKDVGLSNVLLKDEADEDNTKSILLQVAFTMVEHVTTTLVEDGKETQKSNVREADCLWVFESKLVNGEPLGWTIVQIA